MGVSDSIRILIGVAAVAVALSPLMVDAQTSSRKVEGGAFTYEERTTIDTIPFSSLEEESLAEAVIEGGLEAPAAGVPVQAGADKDFYLDPLGLAPRDQRTDLGRTEVPIDSNFSTPKSIPGIQFQTRPVIIPDGPRAYQSFNSSTTAR